MSVVESFFDTKNFSELWGFPNYNTSVSAEVLNGPASSEFFIPFNGLN